MAKLINEVKECIKYSPISQMDPVKLCVICLISTVGGILLGIVIGYAAINF